MRQPKPFFRKFTKTWYVQIGKKQFNLGKDKAKAFDTYHEIMAGRGLTEVSYTKVVELLDAYLDWLSENRKDGTYRKAKHYLNLFAQQLGRSFMVPVTTFDAFHVERGISSTGDFQLAVATAATAIFQIHENHGIPSVPVFKELHRYSGLCSQRAKRNDNRSSFLNDRFAFPSHDFTP